MLSDEELRSLTSEERAELARRLAAVVDPLPHESPATRRRHRLFVDFMALCAIVLIPWIVFLAISLPPRYVAGHWEAAWVGFDVALLIGLAVTAWASWRHRQIVIVSSLMTATLLVTDAWFDVLTSSTTGAVVVSLADALLVELPLAVLLFAAAHRGMRLTQRGTRRLAGAPGPLPRFWKVPIFGIEDPAETLAAVRAEPTGGATPAPPAPPAPAVPVMAVDRTARPVT